MRTRAAAVELTSRASDLGALRIDTKSTLTDPVSEADLAADALDVRVKAVLPKVQLGAAITAKPAQARQMLRFAQASPRIDPQLVDGLLVHRARPRAPLEALTPRQREILAVVAAGRSNLAIARHFGVTQRAVEKHVNEIFGRLGIDTLEVLEAAGSKWNFLPFRPGLVGGHCIGVDPYYLTYKAEMLGHHPDVILAGRDRKSVV